MAPRASWTGILSFGMVALNVGIAPAAKREDVAFKTLAPSGAPVKQVFVDSVTGETVERADTRKGWEFTKGSFVEVTDDELAKFAAQVGKEITLAGFVEAQTVPHEVIERTYLLFPHGGGGRDTTALRRQALAKPYRMIASALRETGMVGQGTMVMGSKQYPVLVRAQGDDLYLDVLYWRDEVRAHDNPEAEVGDDEVALACRLIEAMKVDFALPENTMREEMVEYLSAKAAGEEPNIEEREATAPVVDIMAALKASLAAAA